MIAFARYCLPQVFFYGMFVLVGQVLNARGRFGPMMWAPIANNVVAVAVLVVYLVVYGTAEGAAKQGGFDSGQELLLGLGSTAGIVVQFLVLLPYLRATGYRFRPRFDFRGSGLGHTLRLGVWTVLFVVVNQIAYTVVVRLASHGTVGGASGGAGYTIYSNAFLLTMVPHSIITVSLATAMLPLLSSYAARGDLPSVGRAVSSTLRSAYALIVPAAAFLAVMALDTAHVVWAYGSAQADFGTFAPSLALFGLGLVLFTMHYLLLRGFYALEQNRLVFFIQCGIAVTNIVAAVVLTHGAAVSQVAPRLVVVLRLLLRRGRRAVLHPALATGRWAARAGARALPGPARARGGRRRGAGLGGADAARRPRPRNGPAARPPRPGRGGCDLQRGVHGPGPVAPPHRGDRRHGPGRAASPG